MMLAQAREYDAQTARLLAEEAQRASAAEADKARSSAALAEAERSQASAELVSLRKQAERWRAAEHEAAAAAAQASQCARALDSDVGNLRGQLRSLEGGVRQRDGEISRLLGQLSKARGGEVAEAAKHEKVRALWGHGICIGICMCGKKAFKCSVSTVPLIR